MLRRIFLFLIFLIYYYYYRYWSQTIGTEWETKDIYRKNFSTEFMKFFKNTEYKKFELFDFTPIVDYLK